MLEEGRVGHYDQVGAIQFEAHVDLLGNAGQQLRQGLVDRIERDGAGDARMDVDIDFGVAREREEQIGDLYVVDHNTIGLGLGHGAWFREGQGLLDWCRNVSPGLWQGGLAAEVPGQRLLRRRCLAGGKQ